jgi:hypothetical protein
MFSLMSTSARLGRATDSRKISLQGCYSLGRAPNRRLGIPDLLRSGQSTKCRYKIDIMRKYSPQIYISRYRQLGTFRTNIGIALQHKRTPTQTDCITMTQHFNSGQTRLHRSLERAKLGQGPSVGQWLELPGYSLARTVASLGEDVGQHLT